MLIAQVYLCRHGETEENKTKILQGQLNTVLNESGVRQAGLLAQRFKETRIDLAFSSDLSRAVKTAQIILAHHPNVQLREAKEIRERHLGELQGTPVFRDWKKAIKGGESLEDYKHRTQNWWTTSLLPCALSSFSEVGEQRNILVMSHGGFITTLVRELLASGQLECANDIVMGQCFNTAVAVIEVHGRKVEGEKLTIGKAVLVKYGDVSHLGTEEVRESNWDELAAKSL